MSIDKITKENKVNRKAYQEERFTKSLQGNLAEKGYAFNLNKDEAMQEMQDDRQYLVLDITDKDMYEDLLPIARAIFGYTRKELAERVDLHPDSIANYERGNRYPSGYRNMRLRLILTGTAVPAFNTVEDD